MYDYIRIIIFPAFLILLTAYQAKSQGQVSFKKINDNEINISINGQYFSTFMADKSLPKPVLYPIMDAQQRRLSRGYPFNPIPGERADHPHHFGIWMNYGDVNKVDFWNNGKYPGPAKEHNYGAIQLINGISLDNKNGSLSYQASWKDPDGKELLLEETTLFFNGTDSTREVSRKSRLTALQEVTLGDSKEGFFAIRVRRELENPSTTKDQYVVDTTGTISKNKRHDDLIPVTGMYVNSKGDSGAAVWGEPAAWVMLKGEIEEEKIAIIMLDHPENYGFPARWMARDYGLFGVNPLGEKSYGGSQEKITPLKKGEALNFQYKIIFTSFNPDIEYVENKFQHFAAE